jgi:hypothetical protein
MSVSAISSSPQTLEQAAQALTQQTAQGTSGQEQVKKGGHHHGGGKSAGQSSGTATALAFNPTTGSMAPVGSFSTAAPATKTAPGSVDTVA